jgi:hypothetical protein
VRALFPEQALEDLTLAIVVINGWNRIAIGFRPSRAPPSRRCTRA